MDNNRRIARLVQLLEIFDDECLEHFKRASVTKSEYSRGCYETMLSVIKRIKNTLDLEEL